MTQEKFNLVNSSEAQTNNESANIESSDMEISDTEDINESDDELMEDNVTETKASKSKEILRELSKSKFADEQAKIRVQPPRNAGVPKKYL